eukprot:gnl/MRDRNA2_/MRDRNA2_103454_c0_seq1.p1 gnl/MRDRNA2_/MRDRNA2_103454_c0~~gnl/MRDRNA2_/MRDRNA2_103454_c0_seq1.p1  ORF type:complete len:882 (-),score=141.58 gnl/MRDRNA2_/MRDRNA2_103454_c0_seq1:86-2731(-)
MMFTIAVILSFLRGTSSVASTADGSEKQGTLIRKHVVANGIDVKSFHLDSSKDPPLLRSAAISPTARVETSVEHAMTATSTESGFGTARMYPHYPISSPGLSRLVDDTKMSSSVAIQTTWPGITKLLVTSGCGHNLAAVDDIRVNNALQRKPEPPMPPTGTQPPPSTQLATLKKQRIYITACLHQSEAVLPGFFAELTRLLLALRAPGANQQQLDQKLFVSIYESASTDGTKQGLQELRGHLDFLGIPNAVVSGNELRGTRNRIEFLAAVRNHAMEPLFKGNNTYDQVLWFSDNLFCADGVLQLLWDQLPVAQGGLGADAVCGMDLFKNAATGQCGFYDTWVAKDLSGNNFQNYLPYIHDGPTWAAFEAGQPVQVSSCWNAQLVFAADIFQQAKLGFRRNRGAGECAEAETELIFQDMWNINRGKVVVQPHVAAAYDLAGWQGCALSQQPQDFQTGVSMNWAPRGSTRTCCPMCETCNAAGTCRAEAIVAKMPFVTNEPPASLSATLFSEEDQSSFTFIGDEMRLLTAFSLDATPQTLSTGQRYLVWISGGVMLVIVTLKAWGMKQQHDLGFFIATWAVSSITMVLVNKVATMVFPLPLTLVLLQMLIADFLLLGFCGREIIAEIRGKAASAWRWSLLVMPFAGMLITSIMALHAGRALTLLIVRNLLPIISLFLERLFLPASSNPVTVEAALSLLMIACGTIFYAYKELAAGESSWLVLAYLMVNMVCTICHRLFERHLLTDSSMTLTFVGASQVNNIVGMVPVVLALVANGEHHHWGKYLFSATLWKDMTSVATIVVSGIAGLSLGYSSIAVQKQVSATTMLTLQTTLKMLMISLAVLILHENLNRSTAAGCVLSIAGGVWYSAVLKWGSFKAMFQDKK